MAPENILAWQIEKVEEDDVQSPMAPENILAWQIEKIKEDEG